MHLKLNNYLISGEYMNIPRFGLGTFRLKEQAVIDSVKNQIDDGWRVVAMDVNYEDTDLICDHTNQPIECAYE